MKSRPHRDQNGRFAASPGKQLARIDCAPGNGPFPFTGGWQGSYYDGANTSQARSSFLTFPLVARRELTPFTRREILRKTRAVEANLGLYRRIKTTVGKYSVGFGILPVPQTNSPEWNKESRQKFEDWGDNRSVCDVAGAMTLWERQRFHAETFFGDGESFDALVSSKVSGAPQLQLFDAAEVGGALFPVGGDIANVVDGVRVNEQGRPISYFVQSMASAAAGFFSAGESTEISASDMIHIVRRYRVNQLRGISHFYAGDNPAIDFMDIRGLVTAAAKLHSALGIAVKKKSGDAGKKGMTGRVDKLLGTDGQSVTQVNERFIQGANIQYLGLDEEIELLTSNHPSTNLLQFLEFLIRDICTSTGLPSEIIWNMAELGGANSRIVLADAQWFFDGIQDMINQTFNQRVWVWWCASMMKNGQLSQCPDPRWWNCHWQGPPKLTADAGRAIQGDVMALQNGLLNWEDYHTARGANYQDKIGKQIDAIAWAMDLCEKKGIPFEYIFSLKPGTPTSGSGGLGSSVGGAVE